MGDITINSNPFYHIIEKLGAGNIQGHYAANREEARHIALGLISPGSIVAMGNSSTALIISLI